MEHRYTVGINKLYFPKETRPRDIGEEYQFVVTVKATSRPLAAQKVWARFGKEWLKLILPKETSVRYISLHVNDPTTPNNTSVGRLEPIRVYKD